MGINTLSTTEFERLYGPWERRAPADVLALFEGFRRPLWVAGGWVLKAFTGVSRAHVETDVGVLRADLSIPRRHLANRLDVWTATMAPCVPTWRRYVFMGRLAGGCDRGVVLVGVSMTGARMGVGGSRSWWRRSCR